MNYKTLISTEDLAEYYNDPEWLVVDCRFSLTDTEAGRRDYLQSHIPGAVYANLDKDLSAVVKPGVTGRHPLPYVDVLDSTFSGWGVAEGVQVVAYDDAGGSLAAGRLWWMLRWLGHDCAAVLDGGWSKWIEEGRPVRSGRESRITRDFIPLPHAEKIVSADQVEIMRLDPEYRVIDVRAPERYRGELEPIDPVAGHIPGAVSVPYTGNMTLEGTFLPPEELRELYDGILGEVPAEKVAFYCGSGVTSVHGILAMLHAGYREPKLYVGSWSEWITDPERPVEVE